MKISISASPPELIVKSNLKGFTLLDQIGCADKNAIDGAVFLRNNDPRFCAIEAMAQVGSMHARFTRDFDLHVFLLKIERLDFFTEFGEEGIYRLRAVLQAGSDKAFSYGIRMRTANGARAAEGIFCFASLPYDCLFRKEKLKNHYKEIFECLRGNSNDAF